MNLPFRANALPLAVIAVGTAVSGVLSGYFLLPPDFAQAGSNPPLFGLFFGPGVFFGVATAAICWWLYHADWKWPLVRSLLWVGASTLAWYIAIMITLNGGDFNSSAILYGLAGLAGSVILGIFFWCFVLHVKVIRLGLAVAAGGLLGVAMSWIVNFGSDSFLPGHGSLYLGFALWQVGVALALIAPRRA